MAAKIATVTKVGASGTNIKLKINDGFTLPGSIAQDNFQSFRIWVGLDGYIFLWSNDDPGERSLYVPGELIGWMIGSQEEDDVTRDKFRIDDPCVIDIRNEV